MTNKISVTLMIKSNLMVFLFAIMTFQSLIFAQWSQTNGPYSGGYIRCIIEHNENLFVGTWQSGVYKSSNNGENWISVNIPDENTINTFGKSGNFIFAGTYHGIYRSINNGQNWAPVNDGLTNFVVESFVEKDSFIFIGTHLGRVFRSSNFGTNWIPVSIPNSNAVQCLLVVDDKIYAGTYGTGIFVSTNNGNSWTKLTTGMPTDVRTLIYKDSIFFAGTWANGVYKSTNNGLSWFSANTGLNNPSLKIVRSLINNNNSIYGATHNGIIKSENNGINWFVINNGILPGTPFNCIYSVDSIIHAGSDGSGFLSSSDSGNAWNYKNNGMKGDITSFYSDDSLLYAGTVGGGFFITYDNGESWIKKNKGISFGTIESILKKDSILFASSYSGIYKSYDNGDRWEFCNNGLTSLEVNTMAANDSFIFCGTFDGKVFKSENNGENWIISSFGLPNNIRIEAIGTIDSAIFVAATNGVYKSSNQGISWENTNVNITSILAMTITASKIFVSGNNYGVYRSDNLGQSWIQVNNGFNSYKFFALEGKGNKIYAGSWGDGIYFSNNYGSSWNKVSNSPNYVLQLKIHNDFLFTNGGDKLNLNITDLKDYFTEKVTSNILFNYPNPFNPSTIIKYSIVEESRVKINVYNLLGELVTELANTEQQAGYYETKFNAHNLSSGVYFYSISSEPINGGNAHRDVKKMLLVK